MEKIYGEGTEYVIELVNLTCDLSQHIIRGKQLVEQYPELTPKEKGLVMRSLTYTKNVLNKKADKLIQNLQSGE